MYDKMKGTRQRHICLLLLCVFVLGCWKHCHAADAVREEEKAIDEKTFAQKKLQVSGEDATDEENLYNTRDDDSDKNNKKKTYGYVDDDIGYHYESRHESDGGRDYEREVERVDYHVGHDHHHDRDAHHHEHDHHHHNDRDHHHHDRDHHHHDRDHHHHDRDHHHHHRPDHRKQDENKVDLYVDVEINTPAPKPHHHHHHHHRPQPVAICPSRPPTIQPPPVPNVTPCPPSEQVIINFDNRPIRPIIPTGTIIPTGSSISAPCDGIRKLLTYKASAIGELMKGVLNFDCLKNCLDGRCCLTDCFASICGAGAGAGGSGTIGQPIKSNNNVMQQIAQLNLLHNICGANGGTRVQPTSPPTVLVSSPPGSARYLRRLSDESKVAKAVTEEPATNQDSESSNEAEELFFGLEHSPSKFPKTKEAPKYVNEIEFMSSEEGMHSFEESDTTYNKHNVYGNKKQVYKTGNQLTDALLDSTSAISDHLLRSQTELNLGAPFNTIVNTFNALNEVGEQIENVFRAAINTLETELLNYRLKLGLSAEPITNSQLEACIDPQAFSQFNLNELINLPVKDVLCNLLYSAGNLAPIVKSEATVL